MMTTRALRMTITVAIGLCLLALAACSGSSKDSNGGSDAVGGNDSVTPIGVKSCTKDEDCPGAKCLLSPPNGLNPLCVTTCSDSQPCADSVNYECDAQSGLCKPKFGPKQTGETCGQNSECSIGLTCIDNQICSKECKTNTDCPGTSECRELNGKKVCQGRSYCSSCSSDTDCGAGNRCLKDANGAGFCSYSCVTAGAKCPGGHECKRFDEGGKAVYYCYPLDGACKGDGKVCATCGSDKDCSADHFCYSDPNTTEKYCTRLCESGDDCNAGPVAMECTKPEGKDANQCVPAPTQNIEGFHGTCFPAKTKLCGYCEDDSWCTPQITVNGKSYKAACFVALKGSGTTVEDGSNVCSIDCSTDTTICPTGFSCVTNFAAGFDENDPDKFKACRPSSPPKNVHPGALSCNSGFLCLDKNCNGPLLTGACEMGECVQCPDPVSCK